MSECEGGGGGGGLDAGRSILLCEYSELRAEVNNRTQLSGNLVAIQLAALGAGLSVLEKFPEVVLALAIVSSFLWLLWLDHTSQIYKIAAYLGLCLSESLRVGGVGLGWEDFMRMLDAEPQTTLFGKDAKRQVSWLPTKVIGRFMAFLFGWTPPLLIVGFCVIQHDKWKFDSKGVLWGLLIAVGMTAWIYACFQYRTFKKMRQDIDAAIMLSTPEAESDP